MEHRVLSCAAPLGAGGLGQHLAQLVEETVEAGVRPTVFCTGSMPGAEGVRIVQATRLQATVGAPLQRVSFAAANYVDGVLFDRRVAAELRGLPPFDMFMGFVGKSLASFRESRRARDPVLELIAANSHVENVRERHRQAARATGVRDTWLGRAQVERTLREYDAADRIYVHSEYTRDSFLERGIPENVLVRTHLKPHARFVPPSARVDDGVFRIVYAGRLDATKGVPLLIQAFKKLGIERSELRLVGGYPSRPIRELCSRLIGDDQRVTVAPGDPVDPYQKADVYVHPSFEDGFAYAPVEALACGTPAIVTRDTGMKEYIVPGVNGFVIETGSVESIVDALRETRSRPMASTGSLFGVAPMVE